MNPVAVDIKDMLEAESSLGLVFTTDLFIGFEPTNPDDCVTIYDTPSGPPQLTYDRTERYEYPSVQVRVRNMNYVLGWEMAHNVMNLLHGRGHETWNGAYYSVIKCANGPSFLARDEHGRMLFVVNFDVQRREA